ncbi:MAG: serine hydrolase, partial [Eubacterium sp.]|nr:serine hydrolase [Eubacterium sp.]
MDFKAFTDDIEKNKWCVFGTEAYEDGILTHHWGDTTENLYDIYSATKTVESIAVGIAHDRRLIDFDKSILDYLPKEKVENLSPDQKAIFDKITIHRLLTMSVEGFPFRPEGDTWLDYALSSKIESPETRSFNYSNICTFLVGVALTEALGEDLGEFIER